MNNCECFNFHTSLIQLHGGAFWLAVAPEGLTSAVFIHADGLSWLAVLRFRLVDEGFQQNVFIHLSESPEAGNHGNAPLSKTL